MEKWIKNIKGTIPYTNKTVDIELNGKNLIVTGANGSGKTMFVKTLYDEILFIVENKIKEPISELQKLDADSHSYFHFIGSGQYVDYPDFRFDTRMSNQVDDLADLANDRKAVIKFFEEKRLSEIKQPKTGRQINIDKSKKLGNDLEQHLLNLVTRQSFALTQHLFAEEQEVIENQKLADDIKNWLIDFESKLKILFEDETLKLKFDPNISRFSIIQTDKPPFTFQTLSAGYRAIFDIYADLLMHTEYFKIMPNELTGVVFIDEIDSHLHVSLQRLILPFFAQSFPKIQFIVTTHSPFVLMSAEDTIIFDLAKNQPITENLSHYTYSAVMKGLWNVKPISKSLEDKMIEISKIVNSEEKDYKRLRELVENTRPDIDALDNESKVFLMLGMETLLKEERSKNV